MRQLRRNRSLAAFLLPAAGMALTAVLALGQRASSQPPGDLPDTAPPGQDPNVTLVLERGQRQQIRLAFPAPDVAGTNAAGSQAARELDATLRQDLEWSGIFVIQGPEQLSVQLTGDPARDLEIYRSLGNQALLETTLRQQGDRLVLEGRLYDLGSGQPILGKRYQGELDLARRMAHTFADEIIRYFTGRSGIALSSIAFYSDRTGDREIYLMDYDGHNQRRITGHKTISLSPSWNTQSQEVAYVSFLSGPPGIFLVDLDGGGKRSVIDDGQHNLSPSFSPDGSRLAFARSLAGNWEIYVVNGDGSGLRRLTNSSAIDTNPAWSPTGREIAFTSSRAGGPQIYVMDAEGANLRRVSSGGNYNDGATWSPSGDKLAYASRQGNAFHIVVTDLVSRGDAAISCGGSSCESPSFSPDGRQIAYAQTSSGSSGRTTQIYVAHLDGTAPRRLTSEGSNYAPDWSGARQ
ncbi:MAG: Tol-Pal system beta propeller repeat protein TolB [Thermoanaerobaculia bacterium]